jgi:diguanylate cyclase (GGDEF)-like protein
MSNDVVGHNLFSRFPELPSQWLEQKINGVFRVKTASFIAWQSRPWLFQFKHDRQVPGDIDYMRQDIVVQPIITEGNCDFVSLVVIDATDAAYYQQKLLDTLEKLERTSITDALTSMYNRSHIQQRFPVAFSRARDLKHNLSVIMFDLDHFKSINDTHGHQAGDAVLREIAHRCKPVIRGHDMLARYGGEEFLLLAPETDLSGACLVAERVRQQIALAPVIYQDKVMPITGSFGVAQLAQDMPNAEVLLQCADDALYAAKRSGRNCVFYKNFGGDVSSAQPILAQFSNL